MTRPGLKSAKLARQRENAREPNVKKQQTGSAARLLLSDWLIGSALLIMWLELVADA